MKHKLIALALGISLAACTKPSVPEVDDANNIVVDGKPMERMDFLKKYCSDKPLDGTCNKVSRAEMAAGARSKEGIPRF